MKICIKIYTSLILIICITYVNSTLSKSDKTKPKSKYKTKVGPQAQNVMYRGLVTKEPSIKDILVEHGTYYEKLGERQFFGNILGYVTPWNSHGYKVAQTFTYKFTHVSPVWLQVKRKGNLKYEITGKHDIDTKWMAKLKETNKYTLIVPRILFDGWTINDFTSLFKDKKEQETLAETVVETCINYKFNGIVLELWSQIGGSLRSDILIDFIKILNEELQNKFLDLILVIPPYRKNGQSLFTKEHFDELVNDVTLFSLMTYDYSNPQRPGPNSPIQWIKDCVEALVPESDSHKRNKILLGLNFYGNHYTISGGGPIVGNDFIKFIKEQKGKLKFDKKSQENYLEVKTSTDNHLIYYPTLYSISQRIQLAEELGTGLSIWELGQGLDYFYDLF